MSRSWSLPGIPVCFLLSVLPLLGGGVSQAAAGPSSPTEPRGIRVRVPHRAGTAVRRAVLSVKRRLADRECQRVLSDFSSHALGRPLHDVLDSWGRTPEEHLDTLVFKDGSWKPTCASPETLAFTHVGSDTIYVCASQFNRATERDPTFAEIVLIHELLHTLGLGENPPSSREITAQVTERCGDFGSKAARYARSSRGSARSVPTSLDEATEDDARWVLRVSAVARRRREAPPASFSVPPLGVGTAVGAPAKRAGAVRRADFDHVDASPEERRDREEGQVGLRLGCPGECPWCFPPHRRAVR